jgi:hypothetical protein
VDYQHPDIVFEQKVEHDFLVDLPTLIGRAETGDMEAEYILSRHPSIDELQQIAWLRRAANGGHKKAIGYLGFCYLVGNKVEKDPRRGIELLTESADAGVLAALTTLAYTYYSPDMGLSNAELALKWLTLAATAGDSTSQLLLYERYKYGIGTDRDEKQASELLARYAVYDPGAIEKVRNNILKTVMEGDTAESFNLAKWFYISQMDTPGFDDPKIHKAIGDLSPGQRSEAHAAATDWVAARKKILEAEGKEPWGF